MMSEDIKYLNTYNFISIVSAVIEAHMGTKRKTIADTILQIHFWNEVMLILYTNPYCIECKRVKNYLRDNGIKYEERRLDAEALTELRMDGVYQCCAPILKTNTLPRYIFGVDWILRWLHENCINRNAWSRENHTC